MDFGIFLDFLLRAGGTQADAFREAFDLIDLAEETGLDSVWLGEMHFNPNRSVLSAPIVVAGSIATRTKRLKVGMAVQVLPLINPLRLAEEAATVDQISEGRFEYGVGRSGNARAYETMGIPYEESPERFQEALDIILEAWKGEPFSYHGKYNHIENASLSPLPYQKPHPPVRLASTSEDSYAKVGRLGFPIFLSMRGMDVHDLETNLRDDRRAGASRGRATSRHTLARRIQSFRRPDRLLWRELEPEKGWMADTSRKQTLRSALSFDPSIRRGPDHVISGSITVWLWWAVPIR